MRLKHIKDAEELINKSSYLVGNPEYFKSKWKDLFENSNNLEIEIGMGKGDFIIQKAINNPNINYVGIEKYASVLLRACEKLNEEKISNLKLILYDAFFIDNVFEKEVDLIYLNFSDPWHKKRHAKRRLTHYKFLDNYSKICKDQIQIKQKTDNYNLFLYSKESFLENKFVTKEINEDYGKNIKNTEKTEYEKKFILLNKPIYYQYVIKNNKIL